MAVLRGWLGECEECQMQGEPYLACDLPELRERSREVLRLLRNDGWRVMKGRLLCPDCSEQS